MSKKLITLALLLVIGTLLVACGTKTVVETVEVPGAQVEVTVPVQVETEFDPFSEVQIAPSTPGERGGFLDAVAMSVVSSGQAVTQISAGAIDIYSSNLSKPSDFQAIADAGLERSKQYGIYYELTLNPVGPVTSTGVFNPFSDAKIREAVNWLIDRQYIVDEVYGGSAAKKWFSLVSGFPDYARYVDLIRPLEAKYAYDFDKAKAVFDTEMPTLGATFSGGKWMYDGTQINLIILIRNDSDGTRVPIGDYVASQFEALGFSVTRQYGSSSELSPLWVGGNPDDGLWHIYTGAWGSGAVSRDDGGDFQFFYSPNSGYGFTALWQAYAPSDDFMTCSEALANKTFSTLDERRDLFSQCLELSLQEAYRIWIADGIGASTWQPNVSVAYDLSAGVDINTLWPHTLKFDDHNGGLLKWGDPDLFVDPANPVAGSNWTYDSQWQIATDDYDTYPNPHTGLPMPARIAGADLYIEEGLPVGQTLDWVNMQFVPSIDVPADAWIDWDPATETFITVGEAFPDGLTAKRKVVLYYPDDLFSTVYWHDGSPISTADFIMGMIMTFAPGTEGSPIFDESQAPALESFKSTFKGFKLVSENPLTFEFYSDTYYLDAELNVTPFRTLFWPEYGYGGAPWDVMAIANKAEEEGLLAYSADKADANEIEWMNFIGGPSLAILKDKLDEALASDYIPFAATLGDYITTDEAHARYMRLEAWYTAHSHFWIGTGPYYLQDAFLVEKTATLKYFKYYPDPSDKWLLFATPKIAEVSMDGPGTVATGEEATFDVFVDFEGAPYPSDEVSSVKYLLYDAQGNIAEVGDAAFVEEGHYTVTLSADTTAALEAGSLKIEVAVVVIPVSVPSFATFEFVLE